MPTTIILAILATIVITGLLTAMLYRMNAPKGIRKRDADGDGGLAIYAGGSIGRDRHDSDSDGGADGSSDGGSSGGD